MNEAFVLEIPAAESPYPATRSLLQWKTEEILTQSLTVKDIGVERGITAEKITMNRDGAGLVRPDGYVGFQSGKWEQEAPSIADRVRICSVGHLSASP